MPTDGKRDQFTPADPTTQYPRPEFPAQEQEPSGSTAPMTPYPDHGEHTYRGTGRLAGRVAVVTGGDSGIGRAVAIAFAREGADVLVSYLEEHEDARETARWVEEAGRKVVLVPGDLQEEQLARSLPRRAVDELGRLDIVVNNAAYQMAVDDGLAGITTEQLDRVFRTNLYAMFWLTQAALEHLQPGATVINTSSIQAYQPSPQLLDYASTKGAIVTFTKGLAHDLAGRGIRVNCVAPGPIWTPLIPATTGSPESFGANTPLGRAGQPAELAPAYVFLASQESSYVTGQVLGVTGGKVTA